MYADLPNNILLESSVTNLSKDVVTQPHLIVHVDKKRLVEKVGKIKDSILDKILEGVIATIR